MRECPENITQKLKDINSGLYCRWNGYFCKWQIMHRDDKTGLHRRVSYVQTPKGAYMDLDDPRIEKYFYHIKKSIPWDLVAKYESTEEILNSIDEHNQRIDDKIEQEREARAQEIIKDTMGDNSLRERFGTWN